MTKSSLLRHAVVAALSAFCLVKLSAAGELDGPCSMQLATYTGDGCHSDVISCVQNVTLAPGSAGFPEVTTSGVTQHGSASCFDQPKAASRGAASVTVSMNWVNSTTMTFYGDSDRIPRGYAAFLLTNKAAITVCSGRFEVVSGTCLFSDLGPGGPSPSPNSKPSASSKLETASFVVGGALLAAALSANMNGIGSL